MELRLLGASAVASLAISLVAGGASSGKPKTNAPAVPDLPFKSFPNDQFFTSTVKPLLDGYCVKCHGGKSPTMGLALDRYKDSADVLGDTVAWEKVLARLKAQTMPPAGLPKPSDADRDKVTAWLELKLSQGGCGDVPNPGRVTLRRLNRTEYKNTIRDLVGVDFKVADDFPEDDTGYGFDDIGDVLSLPPLLMEKYVGAATQIVNQAYPRLVPKRPAPAAEAAFTRAFFGKFASRAFRRPATPAEIDRFAGAVMDAEKRGEGFDGGMKLAMEAVLVSPFFLFQYEHDPPAEAKTAVALTPYELASRLSYFLWSSMPDATLFSLARSGALAKPAVLEAQVRRMLKDPKAKALVDNFGGQWLETRQLSVVSPDTTLFPHFNEKIRSDMVAETSLFFQGIIQNDRSVLDFINGDYTYLNGDLAKFYGIPGVSGPQFRRVVLHDGRHAGVLTQASIMTLTSNPTRTSPVKRGKFVLEQFLNDAPPPPPAGVVPLNEAPSVITTASLRVRMEEHRSNPKCAGCHARMDPLGFALENFNGVGRWRTHDGKFPIDSSGVLPDGTKFNGAPGLRALLMTKKKEFGRALTEKILTYALGRGLETYDRCAVDKISDRLTQDHYRFSSLIMGVVESDPFQRRGIEGVNS